jgi:hypothetical protein
MILLTSLWHENKSVIAVYCISVFSAAKVQSKLELCSLGVKRKEKKLPTAHNALKL